MGAETLPTSVSVVVVSDTVMTPEIGTLAR